MELHLRDLPVYIGMVGVIGFFAFVIFQSRMPDKKDQDKEQTKK